MASKVTAIYEPKGAALEYAALACNLRLTCTHGCNYCYCPGVLHKSREVFMVAGPARTGILEALARDADAMVARGDRREVMFSFVGDVFDAAAANDYVTANALMNMVDRGLRFAVLTKGGNRALPAMNLLQHGGRFGVSMAWASDDRREEYEPGAAPIEERLATITEATRRGIQTFASVEPVICRREALTAMRLLAEAGVGEIRIGKAKCDHLPVLPWQWREFCDEARLLLTKRQVPYQIKASLRPYWPAGEPTDTRPVTPAEREN